MFSLAAELWEEPAGPLLLTGTSSGDVDARGWIMLLGFPLALVFAIVRPDGRIIYLLYAPLFLLLYGWIGHTRPWYFPSFLTFSILLLFCGWTCGLDLLLGKVKRHASERISRPRAAQILNFLLFVLFLTVNSYTLNRGEYRHRQRGFCFPSNPWPGMWSLWEAQRYHAYREAAEYLNARADQPAVALISEVGVFGYFYSGDVIDTVGLCSPEALAFYPPPTWDIRDPKGNYYTKANNFTPTEMVMTLKPDLVVNSVTLQPSAMLASGSGGSWPVAR